MSEEIQKKKTGVPREYVLGKADFMEHPFECTPDTLIPRNETRVLVDTALQAILEKEAFEKELLLIEIGTGCGNIAASIAMGSKQVRILASDISPKAVAIAQRNIDAYKLGDRVSLFCGDLFSPFQDKGYEGKIDFIVCNPPYIPTASLEKLASEIIDHEPRVALDGGPYGINIFRGLIAGALSLLKPSGMLFFEIGERQEKLAARLIEKNGGYEDISYFEYEGAIRVLRAKKRGVIA
ncbi:MAG: HemK/PrmC family methyltransferase [Elusimicrobiota bacterium]|jgi:release factor glutamine methyltransferase